MAQRRRNFRERKAEPLSVMTRLDTHLHPSEPGDRVSQEGAGGLASLVGKDLDIRQTGCVVDSDVDELEPLAWGPEGSLSGDAMADAIEASQPLDVDVKQLARSFAFVPDRWWHRLE